MNQLCLTLPTAPQRAHATPLIKFPGSKRWLVQHVSDGIYHRLLKTRGRYIEPFMGSAVVALDLGLPHMVLGDGCEQIANLYETVRRFPAQVAWALHTLVRKGTDEATYYAVRSMSSSPNRAVEAAKLLYLNKLCFNGLWRLNSKGAYNAAYGDQPKPKFPTAEDLKKVSDALASSNIAHRDFRDTLSLAQPGDVIFVDPPYHGTFDRYTKDKFGDEDHRALADLLHQLSDSGAFFVLTNSNTDFVRGLYEWAHVVPTLEPRKINRDATKRGNASCLLATNDLSLLSACNAS